VGEAGWTSRLAPELARERLLDAAGRCFLRHGPASTTSSQVAAEAGCSRPTLYRYFPDRTTLRVAFIRRAAAQLGTSIRAEVDTTRPASEWMTDAVLSALRQVRADPVLAAWFVPDEVGTTLALATSPSLVHDLGAVLAAPPSDDPSRDAASTEDPAEDDESGEWLVRAILSLLATPAADPATERRLVQRLVDALLADDRASGMIAT
jgi:AcrR family transcriptional regulator